MDSRMDKYNTEKPTLKKRTEKNRDLYKNINEGFIATDFDINSNMTVLNTDSRVIDVDKIRDMLDRKYRIEDENKKHLVVPETKDEEIELVNTKEYDINSILEKAKKNKNFDYDKERLKSIHNTQYDILKKLDINSKNEEEKINDDEENLVNLINTITALELKNKTNKKKHEEALEMFPEFADDDNDVDNDSDSEQYETSNNILNFKSDDYEEFEDLKNDIKSNSILIKIVGILFILILIVGVLVFANNYFDLGLF